MANSTSNEELPISFNLEWQWQAYLAKVGLREEEMPLIQRQETKKAFYAGLGSMFLLLRGEWFEYHIKHGDDAALQLVQYTLKQLDDFWKEQILRGLQ